MANVITDAIRKGQKCFIALRTVESKNGFVSYEAGCFHMKHLQAVKDMAERENLLICTQWKRPYSLAPGTLYDNGLLELSECNVNTLEMAI